MLGSDPKQRVTRRSVLRSVVAGGAGIAVLSVLGACASAPTPTPAPAAPPTAAPQATAAPTQAPAAQAAPAGAAAITLRVHARSGVEDQMFNNILPKFAAANPGVKAVVEDYPGGDYLQKLQTLAAGGTIGDVLQAFTSDASYQLFFVNGTLAAIDSYVQRDNLDKTQWYKYSIDACVVDGKQGGLPFKSHPSRVGLFYNADLFTQAGMKPPDLTWTYDQLQAASVKINKPPDVFAFSHPWHDASYYPIMSRIYGGDFFTKDGKSTQLDQPESQQGWAWHYDMMNKYKVTLNPLQTSPLPQDLFVSGKMAMLRANIGTKAAFLGITKFKWNMTLAPQGPKGNRGSLAETDVEAMTKSSKNPDKAWELLKVLTGKDAGIQLSEQTGNRSSTPGGRPDVYNSPEFLGLAYPEGVQQNTLKAMNEVEEWRGPENFRGNEVKGVADELSDLLLLDKAKPDKDYFAKLKTAIQDVLDKPRP
jgi:multiple sugar transport system substrate-binding protein